MSFTRDLAGRAARLRFDDLPVQVVTIAERTLIDTVTVALAAGDERVVAAARDLGATDGGTGACTVWGFAERVGPRRAALANGAAAHALDFDDVCWAMNAHPSAVLWPAALAVAEYAGASGKDALTGYVAGFEAEADIGALLGRAHYAAGWHPTATIGVLGATVTAGRILNLDERALSRALGIACSSAAGTRMNFGTDAKPLHAGFAAEAGVRAALLAARGVTAREDGIEGTMGFAELYSADGGSARAPGFALVDPGVEWKAYPSCRFTHRVIEAVLELRDLRHGRTLRSLTAEIDPFAPSIVIYPRPTTGLEAKFSMEYCAAIAWLDGAPSIEAFTDERAARDDVQHLLRTVVVHAGTADRETVTAEFADGTKEIATVTFAKGSPTRSTDEKDRTAKAFACGGRVLGEKFRDAVAYLGAISTHADLRALHDVLTP